MGLGKWKEVPTLKPKPKLTRAAPALVIPTPSVADVAEDLVEHDKLQ